MQRMLTNFVYQHVATADETRTLNTN